MIGLVWLTALTVYANVARLPSANVSVAVPTGVIVTPPGFQGVALNGGPVVR